MHGHNPDSHWAACLLGLAVVAWAVCLRLKPWLAVVLLLLGVAGCGFRSGPVAGKLCP